jgi:ribosomal protein S18 acetylase RimI-like enzyme
VGLTVRQADTAERDAVARILVEAFAVDPIIEWILPDARNTEAARGGLFDQAAHMYLRDGLVETTAGLEAVALWGQPDPPPREFFGRIFDDVRALVSTFRAAGTALGRAIQLYQTMQQHRPREPHWYLSAIGTRAAARGRGAASSLLEARLAVCDAEGTLTYLESSNAANLALYQRHGFEIVQELRIGEDSPPLWPMRREARVG